MANKKIKNRMFQIYEMRDTVKDAIDNLKKLVKDDILLKQILEGSVYANNFKELTDGIIEEVADYNGKIIIYEERVNKLNTIIDLYEKNDEQSKFVVEIINNLIEGFGLSTEEVHK